MKKGMKPIPFNDEMVRATLDNQKRCTRQVVKPQPRTVYHDGKLYQEDECLFLLAENHDGCLEQIVSPYRPGDILYVRETWCLNNFGWHYRADWSGDNCSDMGADDKWHSPICMPKEAARLFLWVTDVRAERLQDIDADGIRAEGIASLAAHAGDMEIARQEFAIRWDKTVPRHPNKFKRYPYYWDDNPWVWVIEFERISKEAALEGGC